MKNYLKQLYPELKERAKNLGYTAFYAGTAGFLYRNLVNYLIPTPQLTKTGIPYDEVARPILVYLTLFTFDKGLRKLGVVNDSSRIRKYLPHAITLAGWSGVWEGLEYLTSLPETIKVLGPIFLGTVKDFIMDVIVAKFYKSKSKES